MAPKTIIDKLGGPAQVATIAAVHRTRPYGWIKSGSIPIQHIPKLLAEAKAKRLGLKLEDFMPRAA